VHEVGVEPSSDQIGQLCRLALIWFDRENQRHAFTGA
jgi:hypothetical protein